ncbi:hypothetical protein T08_4035 [Trichinella sp. T8]|nr:hypothetical protein T08_4811 [Trichinella sp. T8]KRZ81895.1 hypothetical protein T08_4035 [Trichinella sp. T8]
MKSNTDTFGINEKEMNQWKTNAIEAINVLCAVIGSHCFRSKRFTDVQHSYALP